jgi:hypothetical protein
LAASIVTLHPPLPEQAPVHPTKVEPAAAVAESVTTVPWAKDALQVAPQSIEGVAGAVEETVPAPVPPLVTVSDWLATPKLAVTARSPPIVTTHAPVPEHAPLQPAKAEPAAGVAVSVTVPPLAKVPTQVAPQLMPAGLEVTLPDPAPDFETVSAYDGCCGDTCTEADGTLGPLALFATTVHVYVTPLVSPFSVMVSAVPTELPVAPEPPVQLAV